MSLNSEIRRELSRRGGLSPARLRILRLRRVMRLRRKLRRAGQAAASQESAPCARDATVVKRTAPRITRASVFGLLLLALAACAGAAWGCGWNGFENSVRFGYYSDSWRTRLPPLPTDSAHVARVEEGLSNDQRNAEVNKLWDDARTAVASGELEKTRRLLEHYVERTAGRECDGEWETPKDCRARRNSALDRLDALAALEHGSSPLGVRAYLDARAAYDEWLAGLKLTPEEEGNYWRKPTPEQQESAARKRAERAAGMSAWNEKVEAPLAAAARDANLADNVEYLRAVGIYRAGVQGDAYEAFELIAQRYPRGEKREAALYMAGRLALESSAVYLGDGATATSEDPCREPECRDEGWMRARKNFTQLLADYPRGRYTSDARGRLAYLSYRVGDTAGGLAWYYRMLGDDSDPGGQRLGALSLRLTRYRADEADLDALERDLEDEPDAALAYAYHSVYNYASGDDLPVPEDEEEDLCAGSSTEECERIRERSRAALRLHVEKAELRRAADFASRMVARYPGARVGGAFLVRLAGAQLELGRPKP
ncbi:MAG: tetratricopeptide repeat protein, partial [Pyrinomonadaceae bacterium]